MNAYTSNASLVIHPDDPEWCPDKVEEIVAALRNTGLIAGSLRPEEHSYLVGDKFLDLIAFLGCSPHINLAPQDNLDKYCFVRLIANDNIIALTSKHTHTPRCPHCKKPEINWSDQMMATSLQCNNCGRASAPWLYNWRKSAGFGQFFIEVTEVYPKEAIPQPALLTTLEQQFEISWDYFYLHS